MGGKMAVKRRGPKRRRPSSISSVCPYDSRRVCQDNEGWRADLRIEETKGWTATGHVERSPANACEYVRIRWDTCECVRLRAIVRDNAPEHKRFKTEKRRAEERKKK